MTADAEHRSVLAEGPREASVFPLGLALLVHAALVAAAFVVPRWLERPVLVRKPVIAHLVALGKPRDQSFLPRKETPPPAAAAPRTPSPAPAAAPSSAKKSAPAPAPAKRAPSRRELMERALARAAGRVESEEPPDPERAGEATGSALGTAATSEEGDAYYSAVHEAIQQNYVVPSVISERERMALSAQVLIRIGKDGQLLASDFQKRSGNTLFDSALELAIRKSKLPAPPADLVRTARDGVVLDFRP